MTERESRMYINENIKKYVYFLDTMKIIESLINEDNKFIRRSKKQTTKYGIKKNNIALADQMYEVLRMLEKMNEHDEIILGITRANIFELLTKVGENYLNKFFSPDTKAMKPKYLIEAGILEGK